MVLDVSGSMNYRMDGNTTNDNSLRRITYLKSAASELIEKFAASEYPVYMALVPFSTHADNPGEFQHVQTKKILFCPGKRPYSRRQHKHR